MSENDRILNLTGMVSILKINFFRFYAKMINGG